MPLSPGQVLQNRYRIARLLEQGGFGAVYRAWDMRLKTNCAIKENLDTTHEAQRQFELEASLLASLRHIGSDLGTGLFLCASVHDAMTVAALPLLAFVVASAIAFATGTSEKRGYRRRISNTV